MATNPLHLRGAFPDEWVSSLTGTFLDQRHFDTLLGGEDATVLKPDGAPLLLLRHNVVPLDVCRLAFPALLRAAKPTDARGSAAGGGWYSREGGSTKRANKILSGIVGYYDRRPPRHPHCRATAYTAQDVGGWADVQPFIRATNAVFRTSCPERYAAQMRAIRATHPYWVISPTAFTTVTVNRNVRTAVHTDKGDLPEGFGVMSVLTSGDYDGGYLVFPKYGVAVDVRQGDVLLADVHEFHGNTAIVGDEGGYDRISCVMYFRTGMRECFSPADEYARTS